MTRPQGGLARAAFSLAAGNLANRGLGMLYRVLLSRLLGAQGMGILQLALAAYGAVVAPFIAGLPPGIGRVAARMDDPGSPRTRRLLIILSITAALLAALAATATVAVVPRLGGETWRTVREHIPFALFIPVMVLAVVSSIFRGLFVGLRRVGPMVASHAAEQGVRCAVLATALVLLLHRHWPLSLRLHLVVWNLVIGETVSLLVLLWRYRRLVTGTWVLPGHRQEPASPPPGDTGMGGVARVAVPVALQRSVGSLARLVEATAIPTLLATAGMTSAQALAFYGELGGMTTPLIYLPTVFIFAMTAVLLPAMADARVPQEVTRHRGRQALIWAGHGGAATSVALYLGGDFAVRLLFGDLAAGEITYPYAGRLAILLAAVPYFFYIDAVATTILRGLARAAAPLITDLVSSGVRLGLLFLLVGGARGSVLGVPAAVTAGAVIACLMDLAFACRALDLPWADVRPLLHAAVAMVPAAAAGRWLLGRHWAQGADPALGIWDLLLPQAAALTAALAVYAAVAALLAQRSKQPKTR